jgi:hypothetical protein
LLSLEENMIFIMKNSPPVVNFGKVSKRSNIRPLTSQIRSIRNIKLASSKLVFEFEYVWGYKALDLGMMD